MKFKQLQSHLFFSYIKYKYKYDYKYKGCNRFCAVVNGLYVELITVANWIATIDHLLITKIIMYQFINYKCKHSCNNIAIFLTNDFFVFAFCQKDKLCSINITFF